MPDCTVAPLGRVCASQLRYHLRRVLRAPRAISTGVLLPVVLVLLADPRGAAATHRVVGTATLGAGMIAWTTHGIGLVAARETGELLRWRAMPLPRWCLLAARVAASVLAGTLGGAAPLALGCIGYHVPIDPVSAIAAVGVLVLGAAAWAAPATAMTRFAGSVETAWPILGLTYLPMIFTSGVLGTSGQPSWLRSISSVLPARPQVHALAAVLGQGAFAPTDVLTLLAWTIGGLGLAAATFRWAPTPPHEARLSRDSRAAPASGTGDAASTSSSTRSAGSARGSRRTPGRSRPGCAADRR